MPSRASFLFNHKRRDISYWQVDTSNYYLSYYKSILSPKEGDNKDRYSLAIHLHREHVIKLVEGMDDYYEFTLLEKCTPKSIDLKEHMWIQKRKSLVPFGLNLNSPLGFPLIDIG